MAEKPVPENDPLVNQSLASWYVVSLVILMVSLLWAFWDEDFGQRPWKAYQHEWKDRYSTFLKTARSTSAQSEKDVESNGDYQKLKQNYEQASQQAAPRTKQINDQLRTLSAKILAVQNVFTDRRAYVNALTYNIETTIDASSITTSRGRQRLACSASLATLRPAVSARILSQALPEKPVSRWSKQNANPPRTTCGAT